MAQARAFGSMIGKLVTDTLPANTVFSTWDQTVSERRCLVGLGNMLSWSLSVA